MNFDWLIYQIKCPNVPTNNCNLQTGLLCVSTLGMYINLPNIVLSLRSQFLCTLSLLYIAMCRNLSFSKTCTKLFPTCKSKQRFLKGLGITVRIKKNRVSWRSMFKQIILELRFITSPSPIILKNENKTKYNDDF